MFEFIIESWHFFCLFSFLHPNLPMYPNLLQIHGLSFSLVVIASISTYTYIPKYDLFSPYITHSRTHARARVCARLQGWRFGTCYQAWPLEFDSQGMDSGRREHTHNKVFSDFHTRALVPMWTHTHTYTHRSVKHDLGLQLALPNTRVLHSYP